MKFYCRECDWRGLEPLRAVNPFSEDEDDVMHGCPKCREPNRIGVACDEPDCWEPATCGTATPNGYRKTCGKHRPR